MTVITQIIGGGIVSDFDEFKSYYALANKLMAAMKREQLGDCLRVLGLHVGDYRLRFGATSRDG
jgi:hypothetical protein